MIEVIIIDGKSEDFAELLEKLFQCDCPKCRAEKEAETTKTEPEVKPEEPKPAWTPEVGMLVKEDSSGVIFEITEIKEGFPFVHFLSGEFGTDITACRLTMQECFTPIAELEGLKEGSGIFGVSSNGGIETFKIDSTFLSLCGVKLGDTWFRVNMDGKPRIFGNGKQMFWRTRDRARRFGK